MIYFILLISAFTLFLVAGIILSLSIIIDKMLDNKEELFENKPIEIINENFYFND